MLSICPHAAGAERTWSRFGEILSSKRCSMLMGRVGLLAYVQYNYRVATQMARAPSTQEWSEFLAWLDTLPALPEGVRPGVTTAEAAADANAEIGSGSEDELLEGEERMGPSEEDGADARAVGGAKRLRAT